MAEQLEDPEAQRLRDRLAHRYARLEQSRRTAGAVLWERVSPADVVVATEADDRMAVDKGAA